LHPFPDRIQADRESTVAGPKMSVAPASGAEMVIHPVYRQSPTNKDLPSPGYAVRQIHCASAPRRMRPDQNGRFVDVSLCIAPGLLVANENMRALISLRFHVKKAAHFIGCTGR
jgi:hypothetical protein